MWAAGPVTHIVITSFDATIGVCIAVTVQTLDAGASWVVVPMPLENEDIDQVKLQGTPEDAEHALGVTAADVPDTKIFPGWVVGGEAVCAMTTGPAYKDGYVVGVTEVPLGTGVAAAFPNKPPPHPQLPSASIAQPISLNCPLSSRMLLAAFETPLII